MPVDAQGRTHHPAGSPASIGGQYANQAAPAAAATLTATPEPATVQASFQPQRWVGDQAFDDGPAVQFDIRSVLDSLPIETLRWQGHDDNDDVFATAAQDTLIDGHDGPYYLRIDEEHWEQYLADREAADAADPDAVQQRQADAEAALEAATVQRRADAATGAIEAFAKLDPSAAHDLLLQHLRSIQHPAVTVDEHGQLIDPYTGTPTELTRNEWRIHSDERPATIDSSTVEFDGGDLDNTGATVFGGWGSLASSRFVSPPAGYTVVDHSELEEA